MGFFSKAYKFGGLVAAIAVVFMVVVEEDERRIMLMETGALLVSPLIQLGWKTGLLRRFLEVAHDESGIKYERMIMSKRHFDLIQQFEAKSDHVYIATFPKSGTHFGAQLTVQVGAKGEAKFETIHEYIVALEFEPVNSSVPGCGDILDLDNVEDFDRSPWKVFMTHLAAPHVPYSKDAKYIVIMRNGLDVFVSAQNMLANILPPSWIFDEETMYDKLFEDHPMGWARYYALWWKKKSSSDNILFLFYEDMVKDLEKAVIDVTEFLGMPVEEDTVKKVKYLASIDYMKPNNKRFEPPECVFSSLSWNKRKNKVNMVNKGKVGRGKGSVSPTIREKIKENYRKAFLGTDFPIEKYLEDL